MTKESPTLQALSEAMTTIADTFATCAALAISHVVDTYADILTSNRDWLSRYASDMPLQVNEKAVTSFSSDKTTEGLVISEPSELAQEEEKHMFVWKSTHDDLKGQFKMLDDLYTLLEEKHKDDQERITALAQENISLRAFTVKAFTLLANIETVSHKKGQAQWVKEREELCQQAQVLGILVEDGQEKSA